MPIYLPIAQLCNDNYLKEQQKIQSHANNLAQTTLVSPHLFIVLINKTQLDEILGFYLDPRRPPQ